jgi:hypothetical protein
LSELYNQFKEVIEITLEHKKEEVVKTLVTKYDLPHMSSFVGIILRLFTKSNKLIGAF